LITRRIISRQPLRILRHDLAITETSRPLSVDIGGGVGHQVRKFCERADGLPGARMLLDLSSVTAQAKGLPDGVVKVGRNLFDPFAVLVMGTKAFYLRMLLHD
jgi:demethylsterigmatocystin 6-O-methyltransferase